MPEPQGLPSLLARFILACRPHCRGPFRRYLTKLWADNGGPVQVNVHGFDTVLNNGNNYPILVQDYQWFNAPLVELCHQAAKVKGEPCVMVDVGAATGDSVLLIKARCPGAIKQFVCVEGDAEFHELLSGNMKRFDDVTIVKALLAREETSIPSLVKHHQGTAAAIGSEMIQAVRLDSLAAVKAAPIDVLKVDVDGFDGEVLAGASELLATMRPAVIFEWHPKLAAQTGNDPMRAFNVLREAGYKRFLWFDNPGTFSHFSGACDMETLGKQKDFLLRVNARADEHYDVIALPDSSLINDLDLACMEYARSRADRR